MSKSTNIVTAEIAFTGGEKGRSGRRLLVTVAARDGSDQLGAMLTSEEAFALIERMRDLLCSDGHRNMADKGFNSGAMLEELPRTHPACRRAES